MPHTRQKKKKANRKSLDLEEIKEKQKKQLFEAISKDREKERELQNYIYEMNTEIASLTAKNEALAKEIAEKQLKLAFNTKSEAMSSIQKKEKHGFENAEKT